MGFGTKRVGPRKLWGSIVQALEGGLRDDRRSITIHPLQDDWASLAGAHQGPGGSAQGPAPASLVVVAFTCGHAFRRSAFVSTVLPKLLSDLTAMFPDGPVGGPLQRVVQQLCAE